MYLDNAATTRPNKDILDAIKPYITDMWHNPSAIYSDAIKVREDIESVRCKIANYINCNSDEIYFTSGGSEANNWVIQGFIRKCRKDNVKPIIITSNIEHKSILRCLENIKVEYFKLNVNNKGFVSGVELEELLEQLSNDTTRILVTIQYANNEIGTIQDIELLCDISHEYNALFHTDAVQAFGNISIDIKNNLSVDFMSVSGHKIGALKGIGFLYKKNGIEIEPLIYGTQEKGMRGSTENVVGIISLGKALELYEVDFEKIVSCREYIINELIDRKSVKINGHRFIRLPNNISITLKDNISNQAFIHFLETYDVQVASGSACNSNTIEKSYVLKAIGLIDEDIDKTLRITLPHNINLYDAKSIVDTIVKAIDEFKIINSN